MTGPLANRKRTKAGSGTVSPKRPIQFNWRRNWDKKVAPYLQEELVRQSLDYGLSLQDPNWKGDPPWAQGLDERYHIAKDTLAWYQLLCRSPKVPFFSMAIGVLNYPDLCWTF